jgi:hypothetical protein
MPTMRQFVVDEPDVNGVIEDKLPDRSAMSSGPTGPMGSMGFVTLDPRGWGWVRGG